jgi:hypothetical protein
MNTLDLALKKVKLRRVSGTKGGEWQGPCPGCGGVDRFHVWPMQNEGKGSYWCRGCEKGGDNIQYLRDFEGMTFKDACAYLNIDIPDQPGQPGRNLTQKTPPPEKPQFQPEVKTPPAELWQEKAEKLIAWAQGNLTTNAEALAWLAERGITAETAENYRLGWNPGEDGKDIYRNRKSWGLPEVMKDDGRPRALWIPQGLVIPYIVDGIVHRVRIRRPEGEPRYYVLPGSSTATMIIEPQRRAFVIVESELDAITVAAHNAIAGAVALGSVSAKPDAETYAILQDALQILVALDYDAAGLKALKWWKEQFDRCDRWPVPKGKDPGDAIKMGIDLNIWIQMGLPPALTIATGTELRDPEKNFTPADYDDHREITDLAPPLYELLTLLRKNPGVVIYNSPNRFAVLRQGKYVGGRINELVFRVPEVTDYIMNHPAEEIDGGNLIYGGK